MGEGEYSPLPFITNPIPQLHLSLSSLPWGAARPPGGETARLVPFLSYILSPCGRGQRRGGQIFFLLNTSPFDRGRIPQGAQPCPVRSLPGSPAKRSKASERGIEGDSVRGFSLVIARRPQADDAISAGS